MPAPFDLQPEIDEALLERGVFQQGDRFGDVAVVADRLVEVQYGVQTVFPTPAEKFVDFPEERFARDSRRGFQHDLIESEADVIHPPRGDSSDILFGDVAFEVLHVADGDGVAPRFREHVETFVIGQPPADAHATAKPCKTIDLSHRNSFQFPVFNIEGKTPVCNGKIRNKM